MTNFEYLLKELEGEKSIRAEAILKQACRTYDEYAAICGEIRGLTYAEDLIKDLAQKIRKANAEEEL